jgi:hypothetical protein
MVEKIYDAPPTVAKLMKDNTFGRIVLGPVGSGKTVGMIFELFRRACEQAPGKDGLRHTRFAIVRQTFEQLRMTILKDIEQWLGNVSEWKVSEKTVYITAGDVRSEWLLLPLENIEDQHRLLSSQLTGAWISEAIEIDVNLIGPIAGRCGRYPSADAGVCTWTGIIADTNFPTIGSEWWEFCENPPPNWGVYKQPGGLTAQAENLDWLLQNEHTLTLPMGNPERRAQGRKYYENLATNKNPDWVNRYVHAQYGNDPSGTAVFRATFKRSYHVVEDLEPVSSRMLIVGQDFGRDPCSIICQLDHKGRLLVLEEVIAEDCGLQLHIRSSLRPALFQERYLGHPVIIIGDPAGRAKDTMYEETSFDMLKSEGFMAEPASTNDPEARLRAVEKFLMEQRQGEPAMLIDGDRCPTLVRAFDGGYRFAITRQGNKKAKPDKNEFSHVMDAMQYACLAAGGEMYSSLMGKALNRRKQPSRRPKFSSLAWT